MERISLSRIRRLPRLLSGTPLPPRWVCASCERRGIAWRRMASTSAESPLSSSSPSPSPPQDGSSTQKPYYVTTPIFYVNASPHIGHMYTMVLADVLKRWRTFRGEKALLCTGTDEHGTKIQRAAAAKDMTPEQLCDTNSAVFVELAQKSNIANDFFIRTTDPDHKDAARYFWDMLMSRGYIYEAKHQGWYCVSDETFYPESLIEKRLDPMTGKVLLTSKESGNAVEWMEEKTYHFRMTALKDRLLDFYEKNPEWVVPAARMSQVVDWVKNNLEDLSISRPVSRLKWGIRVPEDDSQTIYVWLEALVNYLTKAGYPGWTPGREHEGGWPADVQVIGKDILRFHCVYWPALLMALDLPLPRRILTHGHWTLGHRKMSKSLGNVVNPFLAIDRFGVDAVRYFLVSAGGIRYDADYGNSLITEKYKKQLQDGLGNLLARVIRAKRWSVRSIVQRAPSELSGLDQAAQDSNDADNAPPEGAEKSWVELALAHRRLLASLPGKVVAHFDQLDPGAAIREIVEVIIETNRYIHFTAPWKFKNCSQDEAEMRQLTASIYHCAESLRIAGILFQPFMPSKAAELLDFLGVDESRRTLAQCRLGADPDYGTSLRDLDKKENLTHLFPPLPVET